MKLARSLVRGSGLIAALAVLGFLTWIVVRSPFLDIKTIEVRGPVEASGLQEVTRTVEGALSGNILTADICAVKQAVEGIAWIKSAYVSRLWPDSLYIEVKRHQSVAIWEDGRLVSEDGVLYISNDEPIERLLQLPAFSGDRSTSSRPCAICRTLTRKSSASVRASKPSRRRFAAAGRWCLSRLSSTRWKSSSDVH